MKKEIPRYNNNPTAQVFESFPESQKKIINDFMKYCEITSSHPATLQKIKVKIIIFRDVLEKDLKKVDLQNLRLFLALLKNSGRAKDSKADMLKQIKRFLIWAYEDYPKRFKRFDDFKRFNKGNKKKRLEPEDLFSQDEINFIIKSIHSIKYKTLIAVLYESGCRPEEILNLTFEKVNFDKKTINVFSNKTKEGRIIPLNESMSHLKRFREEGFVYPTSKTFIFSYSRDETKPMSVQALNDYFSKIENNLQLKKRFYPYMLRHSRLNFLRRVLSPDTYEAVSGHSLKVAMDFYKHLDKEAVIDEMQQRIYEAKTLTPKEKEELERKIEELLKWKDLVREELGILKQETRTLRLKLPQKILNMKIKS